ncbi:acyl carrier protein [Clostridium estertheticum]|uniref:acyl carrier protein n=1 Tax=Clostridium estertheticum TaxID=238834 RepID=UPI001CF3C3A7|nr:acyl carrier protein [Clostridium estertheticum]MCB2360142.1 acyl carrier protein [Clostridium estertheticum]
MEKIDINYILNIIISNTCEVIPELEGHSFKPEDKLGDLGANSLDRAEIVSMTVETLDLEVRRVDLAKTNNIGELAEVLYEKLQSV